MGSQPADSFLDKFLPQRTTYIAQFYFFDQFQITLPPDWNAIILLPKVGIGPVGVRLQAKRELPP